MKIFRLIIIITAVSNMIPALGEDQAPESPVASIYVIYSASHNILFDRWFLPTLKDNYRVISIHPEQLCPTGEFRSTGWSDITLKKVEGIIQAIHEHWGSIFLVSDPDIQFFKPTWPEASQLIKDYDIAFQAYYPRGRGPGKPRNICTGFIVCRANNRTLQLWQDVATYIKQHRGHPTANDQDPLEGLLRQKYDGELIKWGYFSDAFRGGETLPGKHWEPGNHIKLERNIILHHATFTVGIKNKIKQLEYIRTRYDGGNFDG